MAGSANSERREESGRQGSDWLDRIYAASTFVLLNMLWLFCSLFIITMPAATAALFATVAPWGRGQSPSEPLVNFFAAMRKYGLRATAVVLLNLIIGSFVTLTLLILRQMGIGQLLPVLALLATTFVTILLLLGNIYLWPLLVTVDPPLPDLLRNALRLAVHHPFWGLLVAAAALLPFLVSFFLPQLFFITVTFAASALIVYAGAWRVLRRYLDENSIQNLRA
jgi:uncharacterized membrane protein YesL